MTMFKLGRRYPEKYVTVEQTQIKSTEISDILFIKDR